MITTLKNKQNNVNLKRNLNTGGFNTTWLKVPSQGQKASS
jgi:hypothetical protein